MDDVKENKLSMYLKVKLHLQTNSAAYSGITTFSTQVWPDYQTQISNIFTQSAIADLDLTGYAEDKATKRNNLLAAMTVIYNGLAAYAATTNDKTLLRKVDFSATELNRMRDSELYTNSKLLLTICAGITPLTPLIPFLVTTTTIDNLQVASDQYLSVLPNPADQAGRRSQANIELDNLFKKVDTILKDKLDFMAAVVATSNPTVYGLYQQARVIDDTGASTPPTHTGTAAPGLVSLIATYVYNPTRSFRFKNEGTEPLKFGLGADLLTIVLPGVIIAAGSQSTRLSSSLAPNGDNVLVENTGTTPADYKVWVEEG